MDITSLKITTPAYPTLTLRFPQSPLQWISITHYFLLTKSPRKIRLSHNSHQFKIEILASLASKFNAHYFSSTSSMTETLCFLYHLVAQGRAVNPDGFSVLINDSTFEFPKSSKRDVSIDMIKNPNGTYAVNKSTIGETFTILSKLV